MGKSARAGIFSYHAEIQPDILAKSIRGKVTALYLSERSIQKVSFPLNGLVIDGVQVNRRSTTTQILDGQLIIPLKAILGKQIIEISYHGIPKRGLVFGPNYVYSVFFTCNWMICDEAPGIKTDFSIDIIVPKKFITVASGDFISKKSEGKKLVRHSWKENRPYSSYIFGFAAGEFKSASSKLGKSELRYLGVMDDKSSLLQKFKDTARMVKFLEQKSGVPLPHSLYTQVLVPGNVAQEMTSFSVLGKDFIDPILTNPQEDWAILHELAHQWWGNLLTCKSWEQVWLNEGITVFMVAAYKEERWGKAAYDKEMEIIKKRYQRAIDANFDVPLTYKGEYPGLQLQRAIVYSKGALFMDALRKEMGEEAFWSGVQKYTRTNVGRSVVSQEFQKAMEWASSKKLQVIFDKWVY